ncbi:putative Glutathionyl-hydroquinone reductase YqjG [Streptomyces afghaniensis 772]|uniref:Putative Glutathionyl-hydroquinone reductase YqjG n=1 Tax=Streptomyces afghaniensis 772 TaxID=1283301 RepID=S4MT09_9ACTN|nr:putative Glutathionyl-hydroquinone reductase YqjG [Streptomyces afghaniensis 772]
MVDVPSGKTVTNDYQQLTLDLATEWTALHRQGAPDLYPDKLRDEIDEVMADVYEDVNNGVYRAGFATGQEEYETACAAVFRRLELLADRLERQRYLVGDTITEADIRLFTTLVRFDAVYHGHFGGQSAPGGLPDHPGVGGGLEASLAWHVPDMADAVRRLVGAVPGRALRGGRPGGPGSGGHARARRVRRVPAPYGRHPPQHRRGRAQPRLRGARSGHGASGDGADA